MTEAEGAVAFPVRKDDSGHAWVRILTRTTDHKMILLTRHAVHLLVPSDSPPRRYFFTESQRLFETSKRLDPLLTSSLFSAV
jgi:hypothetical protein